MSSIASPENGTEVEAEIDDYEENDSENKEFRASALNDAISELNVIIQIRNNAQIRHLSILWFLKMVRKTLALALNHQCMLHK